MKTLFVYCSEDAAINSLCRESAFKKRDAKALQLTPFSDKSIFGRYFSQHRAKNTTSSKSYDVDFSDYERIIIACDEFAGEIAPEIVDFIKVNNFRYKNVDCIVFGNGRGARRAKDMLKVKISLSGGTVRNCVNVSSKELKREDEDLLFSVRHRLVV